MFLYFFRIAAIVMYILGGYFNNYVLSVAYQISNVFVFPKNGVAGGMERLTLSPRPPDSNRGRVAFHGLLELQSEFRAVSHPEIAYSR